MKGVWKDGLEKKKEDNDWKSKSYIKARAPKETNSGGGRYRNRQDLTKKKKNSRLLAHRKHRGKVKKTRGEEERECDKGTCAVGPGDLFDRSHAGGGVLKPRRRGVQKVARKREFGTETTASGGY